jgi:hypothetical protein
MKLTRSTARAESVPRAIDVGLFPEDLDLKGKSAIAERIVAPGMGR